MSICMSISCGGGLSKAEEMMSGGDLFHEMAGTLESGVTFGYV